ncbi:lysosomal alpha-glucosidase-like [Ornithodoros turicata]|uniref:lysosomal alpha-glucosidase-like n=1 Tax=Ornithodoros turicata TaxID=34597 RepID=UPI0031391D80
MTLRIVPSRYRVIKWMLFLCVAGMVLLSSCSHFSYLGNSSHDSRQEDSQSEAPHRNENIDDYSDREQKSLYRGENPSLCVNVSVDLRIDCHPDRGANKARCISRGCCWHPSAVAGIPQCYAPLNYSGYKTISTDSTKYSIVLTLLRSTPSGFPRDSLHVGIEVRKYDIDTIRIRVTDKQVTRFEPPVPPIAEKAYTESARFQVQLTKEGNLLITFEDITFIFEISSLIFSQFFNQLAVQVPASIIYGIRSENGSYFNPLTRSRHVFYIDEPEDTTYLTANDVPTFYGGHPFLLLLHNRSNVATGLFLLNSNEVEMQLSEGALATFKTTGGVLDFFLFLGPSLTSVMVQYQKVVGFPRLPPKFLLDYYPSGNSVYKKLSEYVTTKTIAEVHNLLSTARKSWNVSIDQKIVVQTREGKAARCDVQNANIRYLIDFTHPAKMEFWFGVLDGTQLFSAKNPYYIIDLEAPRCPKVGNECPLPVRLPYLPPGVTYNRSGIECHTNVLRLSTYRDLKHVYTFLQARTTIDALSSLQMRRQGIIAERTFPGQGSATGHWVRRPRHSWWGLNGALGGLLRYSMYAMPLFGTNVCNFDSNTKDPHGSLCNSWLSLAMFFPLLRREASTSLDGALSETFKNHTVTLRQFFQPYTYTLLFKSSKYGEIVARPMAFEFSDDLKARRLPFQFMWGNALLIVPKMTPRRRRVLRVYFPAGIWYNWHGADRIDSNGEYMNMAAHKHEPGIYIRSGFIVPGDGGPPERYETTLHLVIAPDQTDYATGNAYVDDGISLYSIERKDFSYFSFFYMTNTLTGHCMPCRKRQSAVLTRVTLLGVATTPKAATLNGKPVKFTKVGTTLHLLQLKHPLLQPFSLVWQ